MRFSCAPLIKSTVGDIVVSSSLALSDGVGNTGTSNEGSSHGSH